MEEREKGRESNLLFLRSIVWRFLRERICVGEGERKEIEVSFVSSK